MQGELLEKAHALLTGDRQAERGDAGPNMRRAARIAYELTGKVLTAYDVAMIMVAVKLARQAAKRGPDNLVDAAAYLDIADACNTSEGDA